MRAVQTHAKVCVTLGHVAVGAVLGAVDSTVQTEPLPPLHSGTRCSAFESSAKASLRRTSSGLNASSCSQ